MSQDLLRRYYRLIDERRLWSSSANWSFYLNQLFAGVDLAGKRMLDIGAGTGLLGLYAACRGAARVVCLEPEAAGSRENVRAVFRSTADALTCPQAEMQAVTFQDFDPAGGQFDVVMIHQAINHLDEEACILLHKEEEARRKYRKVLMKMAEVAAPGGRVIIVDVGRRNLFGDLGMRCPFARSIEWHKHQSPRLWLELLEEVGFRRRRVQWFSFNRLGRWGRIFLANALGAYVCGTSFCLVVDKP